MSDKKSNWFARHKILTVIGVLVLLAIIGGASSGGNKTNNNSSANSSTGSKTAATTTNNNAATPKINQPANDGKFQFTITSFTCGETQVTQPDAPDITSQAQGQFCSMGLTVKNIGSVAQDFDASSQFIFDSTAKQYSYSSDATITANPTSSQFPVLETVNPGNSVSGTVVFDIPKGVTPTTATLHDSSASGGVKVSLQ